MKNVLILVVVEDGLGEASLDIVSETIDCLNPCCSGRWSRRERLNHCRALLRCLNPCCSGRWSRRMFCMRVVAK